MYRWLGLTLIMLVAQACAKEEVSSTTKGFFRQPVIERMRTFRTYPIDDQLAIFFYGNQKIHPPAQYLAGCFALNGATGAALLRERLSTPGSDLDTRDIAMLLQTIQSVGTYDVPHDLLLMDRLNARIASMRDQGWKDTATTLRDRIETLIPKAPADVSQCEVGR